MDKDQSKLQESEQVSEFEELQQLFENYTKTDTNLKISNQLKELCKLVKSNTSNMMEMRQALRKANNAITNAEGQNEQLLCKVEEILNKKRILSKEERHEVMKHICVANRKMMEELILQAQKYQAKILKRQIKLLYKACKDITKKNERLNEESKKMLPRIEKMLKELKGLCDQLDELMNECEQTKSKAKLAQCAELIREIREKYKNCLNEFRELRDTTNNKIFDTLWILGEENALYDCKFDSSIKIGFNLKFDVENTLAYLSKLVIDMFSNIDIGRTETSLKKLYKLDITLNNYEKELEEINQRVEKVQKSIEEIEDSIN